MQLRMVKCTWCGKELPKKDAILKFSDCDIYYCSEACQDENDKANDDCGSWYGEISGAWDRYKREYEPSNDEEDPCLSDLVSPIANSRSHYRAFRKRYFKWKKNPSFKKSFWVYDENSEETSEDSGSGEGLGKTIVSLIVLCVVVWLGWKVIKGAWNWMFSGHNHVNAEVVLLEEWEMHLDQRCDAFRNGLSEKEVDAKSLRNYTWEEWQALKRGADESTAPRSAEASKAREEQKTTEPQKDEGFSLGQKAKEVGDFAKGVVRKLTTEKKDLEESPDEQLKRLNARIAELENERKASVPKSPTLPKAEEPQQPPPQMAEPVQHKPVPGTTVSAAATDVQQPIVAEPIKAATVAKDKGDESLRRATKESKGIFATVEVKGKTKAAAMRNAIRQAVWRAVGTWVGSKARIDENREALVELCKDVSETDVGTYEVLDTQEKDGQYVVKVRVGVSKKKIAFKFAKLFPDVFDAE